MPQLQCLSIFWITMIARIATKHCSSLTIKSMKRNYFQHKAYSSANEVAANDFQYQVPQDKKILIHWKGEVKETYSFHFRHYEFAGALEAVAVGTSHRIKYENVLQYDGSDSIPDSLRTYFDESLQFVDGIDDINHVILAAKRCSLVHTAYQVVAIQENYQACSDAAIANGLFSDMYKGAVHDHFAWCLRVRIAKGKRHGERSRSMEEERKALRDLTPLLSKFGGGVDLKNPDCQIILFNGMKGSNCVLARRLVDGPQIHKIAPVTRLCITNTPLCPIAAFSLCNIASVRSGYSVLDPYAGSCSIFLAISTMVPDVQMVGIEIANDQLVNREDIMRDFQVRNLNPPLALIHGDSTVDTIRDDARSFIGGEPFDLIITDPPYGIRESNSHNQDDPIFELCGAMAKDLQDGKPLLKSGGKLVAFIPCSSSTRIEDCIPPKSMLNKAGLEVGDMIEQTLNDNLSRWLVTFHAVNY